MKGVVADTSALVSMALSGQLELAVKNISFSVPKMVNRELQEIGNYRDIEGKAAKKALVLIKANKIQLKAIKNNKGAGSLVDKNTDLGEAECLVLAEKEKIPVILMDDVNAAYALNGLAKAKNITIKISAAAIVELIKTGKLSKRQGIEALRKMIKNRRWEKSVLEYLIQKYLGKL